MNRKQRRAASKNSKESEISDKLNMFEQLPDECLACTKPFDKKNKQMVNTWNVVVRDQNTIRLYCPDCWSLARRVVEQYEKENQTKE